MQLPRWFFSRAWVVVLIGALTYLVVANRTRIGRIVHVTGIAEWSSDAPKPDPMSPTGLAGGTRCMIVRGGNPQSMQWIAQTQQMLARDAWRVRHVDDVNAPQGCSTSAASPVRWWLAVLGWLDHLVTGRSVGLGVEHAALYSDAVLHALFLTAVTAFAAWRFGAFAAVVLAIGVATWFPAAGQFLAGAPDVHGPGWALALGSMLLLLAGIIPRPSRHGERTTPRWFLGAGLLGGLGLWIDAAGMSVVILGVIVGALGAAWHSSRARDSAWRPLPWRAWAIAGCATSVAGYALEYFPGHMSFRVEANHPLLALAWLGAGELLDCATRRLVTGSSPRASKEWIVVGLASLAVLALPIAVLGSASEALWRLDPFAAQLTRLPGGAAAENLVAWLRQGGASPAAWATLLPLVLIVPAIATLRRRDVVDASTRHAVALALAASLVVITVACMQVRAWSTVDAMVLALAVALARRTDARAVATRFAVAGVVLAASVSGAWVQWPASSASARATLPESEVIQLLERDLAHWLRLRSGDDRSIVLASPATTTAITFHGGLRGICSLHAENKDGLAAAVRIVSATTLEEAQTLMQGRGISHVVLPSWDQALERYATLGLGGAAGAGTLERSFIARLRRGELPDWLRAVPHQLPKVPGFSGGSIAVFEYIEDQTHVEALSRLAEYYVEMERARQAAPLLEELRQFPADVGARAALVHVAAAQGDRVALERELTAIQSLLAAGADRHLAWDRRLSLAIVLAQAKQTELARGQVRRCLEDLDEAGIRFATPGALYRMQVLAKRFSLRIEDDALRKLALDLLPPDFRKAL